MFQNALQIGLAFLEGLALIATPCIWPILPLILSTSLSGGRRRPFGVIAGFIASFAGFAWASRWLIGAVGIDLDYVKYGSLALLALFGIVLLSETLSEKFGMLTQNLANLGARIHGPERGGFLSGMAVGALIGLVWTPCAGPILATVLVQIIREPSNILSFYVLLSFALGVGLPMALIALTGRALLNRLGFVRAHATGIRRFFGLLILLSVAYIASGVDLPSLLQQRFGAQTVGSASPEGGAAMQAQANPVAEASPAAAEKLIHPLPHPYPAPPLVVGGAWMNSPPLTIEGLKGKVVLIDFWTYSCINCLRTLPYITAWDRKYRDKGLVIIGVHAPEFAFEKKPENVREAIARYGIRYPVMQDNDLATWENYDNRYWPAHYLIDRDGNVVYTHFGEGEYDTTENNIRVLLGSEEGMAAPDAEAAATPYDAGQTPETYLGLARATSMANVNEARVDQDASYHFPDNLAPDEWALQGDWRVGREKIVAAEAGASLRIRFRAQKLFLVLGSATGEPVKISLTLNGAPLGSSAGPDAPDGATIVKENRLYALVDQGAFKEGLLEIRAEEPGLEAYAFTFGR
jgi:cytochrome c biogenesis protein CcdA/thiol-disulfide isomerase/thioredoxin